MILKKDNFLYGLRNVDGNVFGNVDVDYVFWERRLGSYVPRHVIFLGSIRVRREHNHGRRQNYCSARRRQLTRPARDRERAESRGTGGGRIRGGARPAWRPSFVRSGGQMRGPITTKAYTHSVFMQNTDVGGFWYPKMESCVELAFSVPWHRLWMKTTFQPFFLHATVTLQGNLSSTLVNVVARTCLTIFVACCAPHIQ